jgi:hypothetical protein
MNHKKDFLLRSANKEIVTFDLQHCVGGVLEKLIHNF